MFQKRFFKPILLLGLTFSLTGCALETKEEAAIRLGTANEVENNNSAEAGKLTSVQFYVPVESENKVKIIDIVNSETIGEIEVGEKPVITVFSSTMRNAYVANQASSTISFINTMTLQEEVEVEVGAQPHGMHLSADNKTLYVATVADQFLYVLDTAKAEVTETIDLGAGAKTNYLTAYENTLFVSDHENHAVYVVDTKTNILNHTINTGELPRAAKVSPDGSKLYVPVATTGAIEIYNTTSYEKLGSINGLEGATDLVIAEDGSFAIATSIEGNKIVKIDLATNKITATIDNLAGAKHIAFNRLESRAYVTLSGSDTVSVIDVESFEEVEQITVGEIPHGIEIKALPGIGGSC